MASAPVNPGQKLCLAVHEVEFETAKVPLSMIVLLDHIKRKSLPTELKCRIVLPSGRVSISVWDAPSLETLQTWLDEALASQEPGLVNKVYEVQEDFSYGMAFELARLRAAEKVAAGSRNTIAKISQGASKAGDSLQKQLEVLDQKTHILSGPAEALKTVRTKTATVMESEKVVSAMGSISAGLQSANSAISYWASRVKDSFTKGPASEPADNSFAAAAFEAQSASIPISTQPSNDAVIDPIPSPSSAPVSEKLSRPDAVLPPLEASAKTAAAAEGSPDKQPAASPTKVPPPSVPAPDPKPTFTLNDDLLGDDTPVASGTPTAPVKEGSAQ